MALGVYRHGQGAISHNEGAWPDPRIWAWQALGPRRIHSIPRVGLTPTPDRSARILGRSAPARQLSNTCNLFRCGRYPN